MLYGLLFALFIIVSILLVLIIMIQQSKGGMGFGGLGGGAQMLFGGSGGQDIFQKITWTLGALFMLGSFGLTLMKSKGGEQSRYLRKAAVQQTAPMMPTQTAPSESPAEPAPETVPAESAPAPTAE
jgi:preprotein translocase subunit SecG